MKGKLTRAWAAAVVAAASVAVAACGGGGGGGGGAVTAANFQSQLTKKPITLTFQWFEWPPAEALKKLGALYSKTRPNVTVKVQTVPIANWHDAIFTQFAARKTNFDIPILDSQYIGEAVTDGAVYDMTDFVKKDVDRSAYYPYFFAAYGQYPQSQTGELDPNAHYYGVPFDGDTWVMIYRKDLIPTPPKTWPEMIQAAQKCQQDNPGMSGLAFHTSGASDAAAETFNTVDWIYGGELWNPQAKKIEGVLNSPQGKQAMDVIANQMTPLLPKGAGNWFIDEVNAAINQGKVCIGFNWIGGTAGVMDPKASTLGKTPAEIEQKLGFAALPTYKTNAVPLGGMGMHISKYIDAAHTAEALNFMKWFQQPSVQTEWAKLGGVPGRKDVLNSPAFLDATPYNTVFQQSVSRVKDFWNLPQYTKLVNIESTNVNAAITGTEKPLDALNKMASDQQAVLDGTQ